MNGSHSRFPLRSGLPDELREGRWHPVHLREHGADNFGIVAELRALMAAPELERLGVRPGRRILVSVKPYVPRHKDPVWIITEASIMG